MRRRHELRGQVKYLNVHESSPMMITVHSPLYTFMIYIYITQYTSYILLTPPPVTKTVLLYYIREWCYILLVLSLLTIMWCRICSLSVTTSLAFLCRRVTRGDRRRFILNTHTPSSSTMSTDDIEVANRAQ